MEAGALISELKRRRVIRALVGYGIVAFAVLQIIEPVMHGFHWPDEVLSYAVVALAVGFPIVVGLAWIFDVNAGQIERTAPSSAGPRGTRLGLLLVGIGVLASAPGIVWYFVVRGHARPMSSSSPAAESLMPSIAVLPFADMSPGKDQEYFSDGVAEEILNALAHVEGLRVIGRTSSFSFKGKNEDLRNIGQRLNVANLLEGSVRKEGNRLRITAQLVEAAEGSHLWSQTFDRESNGVFAVQDEIARAVVAALKVSLLPARPLPGNARQTSPEAYAQYMLGRQLWFRGVFARALTAYEKALEIDPQFAGAWAGKGKALKDLAEHIGTSEALRDGCKRGLDAVNKALILDPTLAEGFSARAILRSECFWDWDGAKTDVEQALALGANDPTSQRRHAIIQLEVGRVPEAIAGLRKTIENDPLDPYAWTWIASAYEASGQLDLARSAVERAAEISPELEETIIYNAEIALLERQPTAALKTAEQVKTPNDQLRLEAAAHYDLGHSEASQRALDALMAKFPQEVVGYPVAVIYAWRGDLDHAFEWLGRAYSEQEELLSAVKWDPFLQKLRGDPRYTALLKKMNLPLD